MDSKVKQNYQQVDEFNKKIHSLFKKDPLGAEVLAVWVDFVINTQAELYGKDLYSIGLVEGRKSFVRDILNSTKQAEAKQ